MSAATAPPATSDALLLLRKAGYPAAKVIRLGTPGDSGSRFTEILYVTPDNKARRAYIYQPPGKKSGVDKPKDPILWSYPGWGLPSGYEDVPDAA